MLQESINCTNPILIISPSAREDALRSDVYYIDGKIHRISSEMRFSLLDTGNRVSKVLNLPFVSSLSDSFKKKHTFKEVNECQSRLNRFLNDSFFVDSNTGVYYPIWKYVPCGHCDACNHTKLVSYVQRCQFAMEESQRPAYFVTLTYNRYHLPNDLQVRKRHVQLFKKRFKRNINSLVNSLLDSNLKYNVSPVSAERLKYDYSKDIKFICVSEYGKLGRPHYHLIVFGFPQVSPFEPENDYYFRKLVQYCWRVPHRCNGALYDTFQQYLSKYPKVSKIKVSESDPYSRGYINASLVSSSNVVRYVLKYAFKDIANSDEYQEVKHSDLLQRHLDKLHCNLVDADVYDAAKERKRLVNVSMPKSKKNFRLVSQNLGLQWLKARSSQLYNSNDSKFEYVSVFDKSVKSVNLSGYYLKKLFPSVSDLLPSDLRKSYLDVNYFSQLVQDSQIFPDDVKRAALCTRIYSRDLVPYLAMFDDVVTSDIDLRCLPRDLVCVQKDNEFYFDFVVRCLSTAFDNLVKLSQMVDINQVYKSLALRDEFFNRFKKRTDTEVSLSASKYRRDVIVQSSKSKLS